MDAVRFVAGVLALLLAWWIYAHGWANVIEAVAIVLLRHARWLRRAHEGREQKQYGQLVVLVTEDNEAVPVVQAGPVPEFEKEFKEWERGNA